MTSYLQSKCEHNGSKLTLVNIRLLADLVPLHLLTQPRHAPQKVFFVINPRILPQQPSESPSIHLTQERAHFGMFKVSRQYVLFELPRQDDPE